MMYRTLVMTAIMDLISMMEIEISLIKSIMSIMAVITKVHNGLNFHSGNWEILDQVHDHYFDY